MMHYQLKMAMIPFVVPGSAFFTVSSVSQVPLPCHAVHVLGRCAMLLMVRHAGKPEEVHVEGRSACVQAQDLYAAIQKTLVDVPVQKHKLIFKGKVLVNGKPLDSYGVKERSKSMPLVSGAITEVTPSFPDVKCLLASDICSSCRTLTGHQVTQPSLPGASKYICLFNKPSFNANASVVGPPAVTNQL
jgi:hypothetical protein